MFAIIALVAWAIIGLPLFQAFQDNNHNWLTKDAAGFFTFVLAIIGFFQAGLFLWQLRFIRESLDDAKISADAAKRAAEAAKIQAETSVQQLRAYVYVENAYYEFTSGGKCEISFRVKNFGSTPAHRVRVSSVASCVDWDHGSPTIPMPPSDEEEHWGSMAPNGDFVDSDTHEVQFSVQSQDKIVYLVGVVSYQTVSSEAPQSSSFQYFIGGDAHHDLHAVRGEMIIDAEGNDAT